MNIIYLINLLRKNLIIIILLLAVFIYNFYNLYNKIINSHPKYEISSLWISYENNLFLEIALLGKSISDDYDMYIKTINDIIKSENEEALELDNKGKENFVDKEIVDFNFEYDEKSGKIVGSLATAGLFKKDGYIRDSFVPNKDIFRIAGNNKLFDNFNIFTFKKINSFYYDHLLRIIRDKDMNSSITGTSLVNLPEGFSAPPYGIGIKLRTLAQDDEISVIKNMDLYMGLSNDSFNDKINENIYQFVEWIIRDVQDMSKMAISYNNVRKQTIELIENHTSFVINKLNQRKKDISSFKKFDSNLFIKDGQVIKNLQEEINFKILTNFVTYLLFFIFFTSLFIYLREIISKLYNYKEINKKN